MCRQKQWRLLNNTILLSLACCVVLLADVPAPAQWSDLGLGKSGTTKEEKLEPEEQIRRTREPEKLLALGQQFLAQEDRENAVKCIERAVQYEPELLNDTKQLSPPQWNELWFTERTRLREKHMRPSDAKGRTEIANWLRDAGFYHHANEMLISALAADSKYEPAQKLAYQWNIAYSGPIQIDFALALNHPLLLDSYKDQGIEVQGTGTTQYLVLPFSYHPGGRRLRINKSSLHVTTPNNDRCSTEGILLVEKSKSQQRGIRHGSGQTLATRKFELSLQKESEPLWERISINPPRRRTKDKKKHHMQKETEDAFDMICSNMIPPRVRSTDSRAKIRGKRGNEDKLGSGYGAFIIEIPKNAQEFNCEYRRGPTVHVTRDFLENVQYPTDNLTILQKQKLSRALLPYLEKKDTDPPIAEIAAYKLAAIRTGDKGQNKKENQLEVINPIDMEIEKTLLKAMKRENLRIQQAAFKALVLSPAKLSNSLTDHIISSTETDLLLNLLRQIESTLMSAKRERQQKNIRQYRNRGEEESPLTTALQPLPFSPEAPNLFKILNVCLKSSNQKVRNRALDIILADGSQTSVGALSNAPLPVQKSILERFATLNDQNLQAVILRVLLLHGDQQAVIPLLQAAESLDLKINNILDPLVQTLVRRQDLAITEALLKFLKTCDFSEITESTEFAELLYKLAIRYSDNRRISAAMVNLAMSQFDKPYQAPLQFETRDRRSPRRNRPIRRTSTDPTKMNPALRNMPAFEILLGLVASGENEESAHEAATLLLKSGQLDALNVLLATKAQPVHVQNLIQTLTRDQELHQLESLPVFLVQRFQDEDRQTAAMALQAADELLTVPDTQQRCRLRLAFKETSPLENWAELSVHKDEEIARLATQTLARLANLSQESVQELVQQKSHRTRLNLLEKKSDELKRPHGIYTCFIYTDISLVEEPGRGRHSAKTGRTKQQSLKAKKDAKPSIWQKLAKAVENKTEQQSGVADSVALIERRCFPLYSSQVGLEMQEGNLLRVTQDDQLVAILKNAYTQSSGFMRRRGTQTLQLGIATQPILRKALTSEQAQKAGIAGYVGLSEGYQSLNCKLEYLSLSTWVGQIEPLRSVRAADSSKPLCLTKAIMVLEPMY